MAGRKKRRFNWDELSSEDEQIEVKKPIKKIKEEVTKQSPIKIESKDETKDKISPNKRSTRTSIKREIEEDDNENVKSKILKSSTKQTSMKRELEDDLDKTPAKLIKSTKNIKKFNEEEISSPPKAKQSISKKENKQIKNDTEDNTIVLDKNSQQQPDSEQIDSKYSDLPLINIKSIKIKFNKKDSSKKFNKKHSVSPTKSANCLLTKFKEIKIQLNDDQRNWFNEQLQKYDGSYDAEFDKESKVHVKSTNSRSKR